MIFLVYYESLGGTKPWRYFTGLRYTNTQNSKILKLLFTTKLSLNASCWDRIQEVVL